MNIIHGHVDYSIEITPGVCPSGWDDLALSCTWGTFFHSQMNARIAEAESGCKLYWIAARHGSRIVAGICLGVRHGSLGNVVNALPYFGSHGDALLVANVPVHVMEAVYAHALDLCHSLGALCLTVITSPFAPADHVERLVALLRPNFVERRICQVASLPPPESSSRAEYSDQIMAMYEGRCRTACRKAEKSGFVLSHARSRDDLLSLAALHQANIKAKGGVHKTARFFENTYELACKNALFPAADLLLYDDQVIAGVVFFEFGHCIEYHTIGVHDDFRSCGTINYIVRERMISAGIRGKKIINFGGTWKSQEGVYNFKKSFGAKDRGYCYITVIFRDLADVMDMSREQIVESYPYMFVLPFSELPDA